MIHQLNIYGMDKVEVAIDRLKMFEPKEGYYLAFSGGKDSVVCKALMNMAGVKYDAHYAVTGIDPPELVYFIKRNHPDVIFDIPKDKNGNRITMFTLIPQKKMPPTRLARYCCEQLKECHGEGRLTVTGVRWSESNNRKRNQGQVTIMSSGKNDKALESGYFKKNEQGGLILINDNAESREIVEHCYSKRKVTLNPIIDWTDSDVWEFIHEYEVKYCELYDKGYKRLGCIGCPMNAAAAAAELERYPKFKAMYLNAFDKMLKNMDGEQKWKTAQDVYNWWLQK